MIKITHNGFHGRTDLRYRPLAIETERTPDGTMVSVAVVSRRTARRLNRAVCGINNCRCGEWVAAADQPGDYAWYAPAMNGEVRGNYPQS